MQLALSDLFQVRWTEQIYEEWTRNVAANRPDLSPASLARCRKLMDDHVPDCLVTEYEAFIPTLALPDPDDRHVLAAAIHGGAGLIVTFNLSDFPASVLEDFHEKWSYVAKKEDYRDRSEPADDPKGDYWDHVAFDPEHRLVVVVVPGGRDVEGTEALVGEFRQRTGGRAMRLMTSDADPAYETAILGAYGETVTPPRAGRPGRPKGPDKTPPASLSYVRRSRR
jgi:PIN domain